MGRAMVHPPKITTFDVAAQLSVDNKGFVRTVARYRVAPFGLYLSRAMVGRASAHWLRSWLLPELGLAVTDFSWNPGHERDQDFYLDVCVIERDGDRWRLTDLYLDIVVRTGRDAQVIDLDEFVAAVGAGLLDAPRAEHALRCSYAAVDGLAAHGHDLDAWLATRGIALTWEAGPPARG
jgi:hypothetical protein